MKTTTTIIVNLQIEGLHKWENAAKEVPSVAYLADTHRHMFHITAEKVVNHDDRDVEIIMFKKHMTNSIMTKYRNTLEPDWRSVADFGSKSCEMLAKEFMELFDLHSCQVLEDGENGSKVYKIYNN